MSSTGFITLAEKEEIRRRISLEDLLAEYGVTLVDAGRKRRALCPFHQEKTPSFYVDVEKQLYYCHGCHAGGDLFRFVEQMDRVGWKDAVEMLARRAGVTLERRRREPGSSGRSGGAVALYDALEMAAASFHETLLNDHRARVARDYLRRRGIGEEMWRRFRLGYSLPEWDAILRKGAARGLRPEVLAKAGLVRCREPRSGSARRGYYDLFRNRVMFPITDVQRRVIGFGARTLGDDVPKYINTPATPLFDKSQVLYGLSEGKGGIRREDRIIIVEGYTDVIVAHQAGIDNVVAGLGTAFTGDNARQLHRLASRVVIVFDGDAAGQNASERSLDLLVSEDLDVRVFQVPGGQDPCDAILSAGGDAFRSSLEKESVGIFEFKWRRTVGAIGSAESVGSGSGEESSLIARGRAMDEFLRLLAQVKNVVTRKLLLREYAERLDIDEKDLEERLKAIAGRGRGRADAGSGERPMRAAESERAGRFGRTREKATDAPDGVGELAELVIECLFALSSEASSMWNKVPRGLFRGETAEALARAVDDALREGSLSAVRLAKELEHPEARGIVVKLLSRLEGDDGSPVTDYPLVWQNCQKDIRRWEILEQVAELDRLAKQARGEEDQESLRTYRLRRNRLLKELKLRR